MLPDSISFLKDLKSLQIASNQLRSFPKSFVKLRRLEKLNASWNQIESLPDGFEKLTALEDLRLGHNSMKVIDGEVMNLPKLRVFDIVANPLNAECAAIVRQHGFKDSGMPRCVSLPCLNVAVALLLCMHGGTDVGCELQQA